MEALLTKESSGDEYFYKINTVTSIIKLGSTYVLQFKKKTTLISVFAANGFTSAIIVLFRISTVHGQLLTKNLMTASKSSPEASRPSRIASRNPVGSYCFFSSRNF